MNLSHVSENQVETKLDKSWWLLSTKIVISYFILLFSILLLNWQNSWRGRAEVWGEMRCFDLQ